MNPIDTYARDVVSGRLPAGKYHKLACSRHLRDRQREGTPAFPYRFDAEKADRFAAFVGLLKHYKGEWAGQAIQLQPWQQFMLGSLFGWVHAQTGLRRFRSTYFEIPRKNGKSTIAATAALYLTFFDGEPGAEGYTIATKRDQAKIVFTDAKQMVLSSGLKSRIAHRVANLHRADTSCKLEPLGADHDSTDGLNPHLVVIDEWHAYKDRGLIDVMETATGARRQPVIFGITTAGDDPVSPCGDQHDYACKVLDGVLQDESILAFIAHADVDDDPWSEATWQKANPNWNVSVKPDDMRALAQKAKSMTPAAATFKQKRLNMWVNNDQPWLSLDGWRKGQSDTPHAQFVEALKGRRCFMGIDLSSKIDLTAVTLLFPPDADESWKLLSYCYTPEETLIERERRDRAPYRQWVNEGWLETTPGTRIEYRIVRDKVNELAEIYDVAQIGFDQYNFGDLYNNLLADGFSDQQVIEVPQTVPSMSQPSKDFGADVLAGHVDANGNPLVRWCIGNAVVLIDNKENIFVTKKKSRGRIDPVVAAIMARKLAGVEAIESAPVFAAWV